MLNEWMVGAFDYAIVALHGLAFFLILFGTVEACAGGVAQMFARPSGDERRALWLRYGRRLVAALTFQIAAHVVELSISASWESVVKLAAIALIRTFLNYFLERDRSELRERQRRPDLAKAA